MIDNSLTFTLLQRNGLRNIILVLVYPLGWEAHFRQIARIARIAQNPVLIDLRYQAVFNTEIVQIAFTWHNFVKAY